MKKKTVVFGFFVILLVTIGFVGYSFTTITAEVGDTSLSSHIVRKFEIFDFSFEGFIALDTEVSIDNSAYWGLDNLNVYLQVFLKVDGFDEVLVGEGDNFLGLIEAGESKDYLIQMNVTEQIPMFALNDGVIRIEITISVYAQYIPYQVIIGEEVIENWDHPIW